MNKITITPTENKNKILENFGSIHNKKRNINIIIYLKVMPKNI